MTGKLGGIYLGTMPQLEPSEVARLVRIIPGEISKIPYIIITCIDSDRELNLSMPSVQKLLDLNLPVQSIGNSLLTTGDAVVKMAVEIEFFWGFDELWAFDLEPRNGIPADIWVRSAEILEARANLNRPDAMQWCEYLSSWMSESGAVMGLADGISLDYVTTHEEFAMTLDRIYAV